MKRIAVSVGDDVHKAAMRMAEKMEVSISSLGDQIFMIYGKSEYERVSSTLRLLENAEIHPDSLKEAEEMKKRIRIEMEPFKELAEIFDKEDQRRIQVVDAALDEEFGKKGGKKK
jgi:anion-transporting  ArsA/GET3 family ATPase